jgi:hypothetical protein
MTLPVRLAMLDLFGSDWGMTIALSFIPSLRCPLGGANDGGRGVNFVNFQPSDAAAGSE